METIADNTQFNNYTTPLGVVVIVCTTSLNIQSSVFFLQIFYAEFFLNKIISHHQLSSKFYIYFGATKVSAFMKPSSGSFISKNIIGST
jgi:hypothetical protein